MLWRSESHRRKSFFFLLLFFLHRGRCGGGGLSDRGRVVWGRTGSSIPWVASSSGWFATIVWGLRCSWFATVVRGLRCSWFATIVRGRCCSSWGRFIVEWWGRQRCGYLKCRSGFLFGWRRSWSWNRFPGSKIVPRIDPALSRLFPVFSELLLYPFCLFPLKKTIDSALDEIISLKKKRNKSWM